MHVGYRLDRGETSAQLVIVLPLVVFILLLAIQGALFFHVSHVAGAAAAQGAAAASASTLSSMEASRRGRERSESLVREMGSNLTGPTVVAVSAAEVQVTVGVMVPRIVPFFPAGAIRSVVEPRERFIAEIQR